MARTRSPKFPRYSVEKAINYAHDIYKEDRRNPLDREVIAKHMGYSSLNGAADKAIATMNQYGLLERVGKGEMCLTPIAEDIVVPDTPDQRFGAMVEAANNPDIFRILDERFPGGKCSDDALRNYLVRAEFSDEAVSLASKAYRETKSYIEREIASDSGLKEDEEGAESVLSEDDNEDNSMQNQTSTSTNDAVDTIKETSTLPAMGKGERLLDAGQLSKAGASYKLIVTGEIGEREYDTLLRKLEINKEWLVDSEDENTEQPIMN